MRRQFGQRLGLFLTDPRHPQLNTHSLSGKYSGCWSMNVSGDIRAVFEYQDGQAGDLIFSDWHAHTTLLKPKLSADTASDLITIRIMASRTSSYHLKASSANK